MKSASSTWWPIAYSTHLIALSLERLGILHLVMMEGGVKHVRPLAAISPSLAPQAEDGTSRVVRNCDTPECHNSVMYMFWDLLFHFTRLIMRF
jgi:hypothetical protein